MLKTLNKKKLPPSPNLLLLTIANCNFSSLFAVFLLFSNAGLSLSEMRIRPEGIGPNGSIYVLSAGSSLQLECELESGDFGEAEEDVNALEWTRGQLRIAHNWLSMYTQPKVDEQRRWIRQTLVIPKVSEQNAGDYKCLFYDGMQRNVHLHVLDEINWRAKSERPGGSLGQPLTIDCGAEGIPDEAIKILDVRGRAIEETLGHEEEEETGTGTGTVLVTGAELTLPTLKREHQGLKIRCVAIRPISLKEIGVDGGSDDSVDSVHTDERDLTVEVWIAPKFDEHFPSPISTSSSSSSNRQHYAVPGSKQILRWTILESNPPVQTWTLSKDGAKFDVDAASKEKTSFSSSSPRVQIVQRLNESRPVFVLSIDSVQDEDFGRYSLSAHNGKLEAHQAQTLVVTQPPAQPRVSVEWVSSNGSVSLRMEEQPGRGQLPVAYFWIVYRPVKRVSVPSTTQNVTKSMEKVGEQTVEVPARTQHIESIAPTPSPIPNTTITSQSYRVRRRKNPNNLYEIAGLEPYTEYEFTFVAGNQAGESDPLALRLSTVDRPLHEEGGKWEREKEGDGRIGVAGAALRHVASAELRIVFVSLLPLFFVSKMLVAR